MNAWPVGFDSALLERLGWVLVHSLWQAALVASCLIVVLRALARRSASSRYLACCAALLLTFLLPVVTFCRWTPLPADRPAIEEFHEFASTEGHSISGEVREALQPVDHAPPSALRSPIDVDRYAITPATTTPVVPWREILTATLHPYLPAIVRL